MIITKDDDYNEGKMTIMMMTTMMSFIMMMFWWWWLRMFQFCNMMIMIMLLLLPYWQWLNDYNWWLLWQWWSLWYIIIIQNVCFEKLITWKTKNAYAWQNTFNLVCTENVNCPIGPSWWSDFNVIINDLSNE